MQGYISLPAFKAMGKSLAQQTLMVVGFNEDNQPLACALYFFDEKNLYGRYWGSLFDMPFLHFELCYYQGIEHCIEAGLEHFDPGTQGEHKIARGFEPVFTQSLHYLEHKGFHEAVGNFVTEEFEALKKYKQDCYGQLPFNEQFMPSPRMFCL
jgi:predicted N-acyltransferase